MQLGSDAQIPDGLLAAMTLLNEKPHQGVPSWKSALHQGIDERNSTAAIGIRASAQLNRVWPRFTGKERDTESGLDYFGARYYASSMGRFSSPDPSGLYFADPTNPQSLNLYSYVQNNPLKNIDPTGLDCVYFNDGGTGVDTDANGRVIGIDHNSNSIECGKNGGDWVNGSTSANQVQYNANNGTFNIQSSSAFYNYNTTVYAPGTQSDGTSCFGNCDTANGYSQSIKWPDFTLQLGLSAGATQGIFSGSVFAGFIVDSHGHVGGYYGHGLGLGAGEGADGGVQVGYSNSNHICGYAGPFVDANVSGGALGGGAVDVFTGPGPGPGGVVSGAALTGGLGGGAGASLQRTVTTVVPFKGKGCD